ncbi:tRNA (guanosine(46)-N7)-methyltransferase TrmB [Sporolactobacillus inulinus]|jgi:tRNA (guanine-N7-)-methyltransferase|uniref:tRNA (guanine-N(7)-)-methyltransferase n=1 Tax=Sporolactobacillus inulinus CASD TaxID=1069536 RepID=A0A0U1QQE1_9BACL|nr:tRNA (guanosine(46)-N7)-methyltransferase TrmB [Sporolactobacillus inulinus]KLI02846.1 tRNA (guanine-N7)-methyltransferase [Sporolactobacillus inulinus CASD]GEB75747.1 tRNA (guanine-N(7)-)-methyltransferase [Sporolactobacillus inulinus]
MRVRHKPWAKSKLNQHSNLVVQSPKDHSGEWYDIFHREAPLHVEIGTGKGRFLTGMAKKYPDINFVGIELHESVIVTALQRCLDEGLDNVRLINEDARGLTEFFAEDEVDALYLNFCDPWPKNRHEKRRLTYSAFLAQYEYVLKKGGLLNFKTDNQGLFEYSLESFSKYGFILQNISLDLHHAKTKDNVVTEYEEKFAEKGQRIYRCEAISSE